MLQPWVQLGQGYFSQAAGWADPSQPVRWGLPHHVMPCSIFKWGAGRREGICYSGGSWASGGENIACCVFFLSVLLLLFSSLSTILLNCFYHNPWVLPSPSDLFLCPMGEEWERNCLVLCGQLKLKHNTDTGDIGVGAPVPNSCSRLGNIVNSGGRNSLVFK